MLSEGQTVFLVAETQNVKPEAIRELRCRWLKNGLDSLPAQPRCGAPSKVTEAHRDQLKEWVDAEALTSRDLVSRLATGCCITISASMLRAELKHLGYVWIHDLRHAFGRRLRAEGVSLKIAKIC